VELFAGLEAHSLSWGDCDLGTGAGIAAHAGFTRFDGEDAEAAELNAVAFAERLFHGLEDGINGGFRLDAWKPGAFDNSLDEVLLDQWVAFLSAKQIWCLPVMMGRPQVEW
jgi:hypothetical protein